MKFALCIEYNGSNYYGWQIQKGLSSIQKELESVLSKIAGHKILVQCGGRTDKGVHSLGQIVHFETSVIRKDYSWLIGINSNLPKDIVVHWIKIVPNYFHARTSAVNRYYRYYIYNNKIRTALNYNRVTHIYKKLDLDCMLQASKLFIGEHNFNSFRSSYCQSVSSFRNVLYINVKRDNFFIIIDIKANSFLHNMVRKIVGSLIEIGSKNKNINWIQYILNSNKKVYVPTAQSSGLYLVSIEYPSEFNLPLMQPNFIF
ncbi:tRNA pseudouridine(38-40) synthase TruA [Buchnera aphidicola (Neophyllaphis podocarpi)]|uniref:tRNA pseudouridine(38-40) synthase TruA n=1 Tax=Buchnera aphidicola TaxID=9 RepID=UPI0031B875EC